MSVFVPDGQTTDTLAKPQGYYVSPPKYRFLVLVMCLVLLFVTVFFINSLGVQTAYDIFKHNLGGKITSVEITRGVDNVVTVLNDKQSAEVLNVLKRTRVLNHDGNILNGVFAVIIKTEVGSFKIGQFGITLDSQTEGKPGKFKIEKTQQFKEDILNILEGK